MYAGPNFKIEIQLKNLKLPSISRIKQWYGIFTINKTTKTRQH